MIKAVIFDIDGVLIDSFEANLNFFSDLLFHFGYQPLTREEFVPFFHVPMKGIIRHFTKLTDEKEVEKIWMAGRDSEVPYPFELATGSEFMDETVRSLSQNYVLGIVTSRTKNKIYVLPPLAELEKYFKIAVGFEDTENHKPHPDPLILAAKKLGIPPEECVYVGDSESDAIAAKAAGMKAIIYSKKVSETADACTMLFTDLPELIKKL